MKTTKEDLRQDIEKLYRLQEVINEFKQTGFSKYVKEHKLSLLDSRLEKLDILLDKGILQD